MVPYCGEDEEGNLVPPPEDIFEEFFESVQKKDERGFVNWSGRVLECMNITIQTMMIAERMMKFMVEAGLK